MSSSDLQLQDLLSAALEDTVATGHAEAARWLTAQLEQRGTEAMWEGASLLLAALAVRPAYGLPPHEAADRLRLTARTAQPDVALVLSLRLALWERGEEAAAEVWHAAPVDLRRHAIMHLVIAYCATVGYDGRRLSPAETVSLVRQAFPAPPRTAA
ncbi:hypothetical protein AB0A71_34475 [Kitasatospora aureofaciens]|uniref:hypothetical protein n=1 Tax=Kitasatospora aureofaciens TaxID=1894 RepID=UPI0033E46257